MKKNIIFILVFINLLFCFKMKVNSLTYDGCEYSEVSRLKSIVSNVNMIYDYYTLNNSVYFNITLTNITPDIYFIDSSTGKIYNYGNTIDGEITISGYRHQTGNYKFYSALDKCYGVKLSNKYYNLPTYNIYYTDDLCKKNSNYSLCQKWTNVSYSYDEFKSLIEEYNKKENVNIEKDSNIVYEKTYLDAIVNFYTKYYYFILIGIIVICVSIMVINKKKNSFDI